MLGTMHTLHYNEQSGMLVGITMSSGGAAPMALTVDPISGKITPVSDSLRSFFIPLQNVGAFDQHAQKLYGVVKKPRGSTDDDQMFYLMEVDIANKKLTNGGPQVCDNANRRSECF